MEQTEYKKKNKEIKYYHNWIIKKKNNNKIK